MNDRNDYEIRERRERGATPLLFKEESYLIIEHERFVNQTSRGTQEDI